MTCLTQLLADVRTEVTIDHRSFDLLDDGGPQGVVPGFGDPARWLFTGRNSVTAPLMDGWQKTGMAVLAFDSGLLEVNPLVEAEAEYLNLRGSGIYHLRAHATGERYVFQFWAEQPRSAP